MNNTHCILCANCDEALKKAYDKGWDDMKKRFESSEEYTYKQKWEKLAEKLLEVQNEYGPHEAHW